MSDHICTIRTTLPRPKMFHAFGAGGGSAEGEAYVPLDWPIFVATRPLLGDDFIVGDEGSELYGKHVIASWNSTFLHGTHYCSLDPTRETFAERVQDIADDAGIAVVEWGVSNETILQEYISYLKGRYDTARVDDILSKTQMSNLVEYARNHFQDYSMVKMSVSDFVEKYKE